jgi:hypothetical protein
MKKTALWILGVVAAIAAIIAVWLWFNRSTVIELPDGARIRLAGITYGKHHVAPKIKINGARRGGGNFLDTTNDTVMFWFVCELRVERWPNYQLLVSDQANTACVSTWQRTSSHV